MDLVDIIEQEQQKNDIPDFQSGDTVRVNTRIREGQKERIQAYEGTVIKRLDRGARSTFTVRRLAYGTGSERTFPLHSPNIQSISIVKRGVVRRAKLYYLRDRKGKSARIAEKIKKKIGVDVSVKPEETKKIVEPVKVEVSSDKKKEALSEEVKVEKSTNEKK